MRIKKEGFVFEVEYSPDKTAMISEDGQKTQPDDPEYFEIIGVEIDTEWKALEYFETEFYHDLLARARNQCFIL